MPATTKFPFSLSEEAYPDDVEGTGPASLSVGQDAHPDGIEGEGDRRTQQAVVQVGEQWATGPPEARRLTIPALPAGVQGFYSRAQVCAITSLTATTLWRRMKAGDFPKSVALTPGRVAWPRQAVDEWIRKKTEAANETTS